MFNSSLNSLTPLIEIGEFFFPFSSLVDKKSSYVSFHSQCIFKGNLILLLITRELTNVAKLGSLEFEPRLLPGRFALEESSFLSSSWRTSEPLSGSKSILERFH